MKSVIALLLAGIPAFFTIGCTSHEISTKHYGRAIGPSESAPPPPHLITGSKYNKMHKLVCPLCNEIFVPQYQEENALNTCPKCGAKIPYTSVKPRKQLCQCREGRPCNCFFGICLCGKTGYREGVRVYRYNEGRNIYHYGGRR